MSQKENPLETAAQSLKKCPLCETDANWKISGFLGKMLECNNCKAKWSGGITTDTEEIWLTLKNPAKTGTGKNLLNKVFPFNFWLAEDKPYLKYDNYAKTTFEAFKDLKNTPLEIGKATFKGANVLLWGPSADCVAEIFPFRKGINVTTVVIDLTAKLKEKTNQENDFFYQLISKRLQILSEKIPIIPYLKTNKDYEKVEENRFYPYKERDIAIPGEIMPHLIRYGVIKEAPE